MKMLLEMLKLIAIGCDAVKLEGGTEVCERISAIDNAGIPVMAHLGLTPQSLSQMGGYRVQGKNLASFKKLLEDTLAVESAGAFSVLIEAIPEDVSAELYKHIKVPLYGIGAGKHVDGQLVISHDMLGLFVGEVDPKFVKKYLNLSESITNAFKESVIRNKRSWNYIKTILENWNREGKNDGRIGENPKKSGYNQYFRR